MTNRGKTIGHSVLRLRRANYSRPKDAHGFPQEIRGDRSHTKHAWMETTPHTSQFIDKSKSWTPRAAMKGTRMVLEKFIEKIFGSR